MNSNKTDRMTHHNKDVDAIYESYGKVSKAEQERLEEEYDVGRDPNMIARLQDALGNSGLSPNDVREISRAVQNPQDQYAPQTFQRFGIDQDLTKSLSDILTPNLQQRAGQFGGRALRGAANVVGDVANVAKKGLQATGLMQKSERDPSLKRGSLDPHYRDQPETPEPSEWEDDAASAPVPQGGVMASMGQGAFLPGQDEEEGTPNAQTYGHTGGAGGARGGLTQGQTNQRQQQAYRGPGGQDQPRRGDRRATPNTPLARDIQSNDARQRQRQERRDAGSP